MMRRLRRSDGFTLIELIVVMAIIVVLAGMSMVQYQNSQKRAMEAFRDRGTPESKAYYLAHWRQLFTLVMNTVIYCTWPDAELRQVQNPEFTKLQEQMKKHPKGSHKYERTRERSDFALPT